MTGRAMFEPIGTRARWRIVYDLLQTLNHEDVITFQTLASALGLDPDHDRAVITQAALRAGKELTVVNSRSIENVRGVGYRVVLPSEHVMLAGKAQRRSGRILKSGTRHVEHVDLSKLDDNQRALVYATLRALKFQEQQFEALRIRQDRTAALVESVQQRGQETAGRVTEQDERLRRLEEQLARLTGDGES